MHAGGVKVEASEVRSLLIHGSCAKDRGHVPPLLVVLRAVVEVLRVVVVTIFSNVNNVLHCVTIENRRIPMAAPSPMLMKSFMLLKGRRVHVQYTDE